MVDILENWLKIFLRSSLLNRISETVENKFRRKEGINSLWVHDTWQIFTKRLDGDNMRQITRPPGNNNEANYSPNNRHFAYLSDRDGNRELYFMNADGSSPRQLMLEEGA